MKCITEVGFMEIYEYLAYKHDKPRKHPLLLFCVENLEEAILSCRLHI
jgi:hypothetical protein